MMRRDDLSASFIRRAVLLLIFSAVMALRRPDGSDIPLEELPPVKAFTRGETILADEIVIHPPDGRRAIRALVNARPIRRDGGDIVSVVATIQDITPLEEMKRQRTEFLRNVSHELRTPLSAIKGSTSTLLGSTYPLSPAETRQFLRVIDEQSDHMRRLINDLVDITQIEFGDAVGPSRTHGRGGVAAPSEGGARPICRWRPRRTGAGAESPKGDGR